MPRSASRDLADRFADNRGYFRQPDGLRRAKNWAALAALAVALSWAAVDAFTPTWAAGRVHYSHTHGPLASAHAAWDSNCQACHVPSSPAALGLASTYDAQTRWSATGNLTCEKCHAGPPHHRDVAAADIHKQCASCHHDHAGRDQSLVKLADRHCVQCHADVPKYRTQDPRQRQSVPYPPAEKITGFADHPEFHVLATEANPAFATPERPAFRRALKFSHAQHMAPGQGLTKDRPLWTLGRFTSPDDRKRYRAQEQPDKDNTPVQLQCQSCHQLDSGIAATFEPGGEAFKQLLRPLAGQPKAAVLPPRSDGAYYLPVNYDVHCKACHPVAAPDLKSGGAVIPGFALSHRRQPTEVRDTLRGEYARRLIAPDNPATPAPAGPGGRFDPRAPAGPAPFRAEVDRLADEALKVLLLGATGTGGYACGKCHTVEDPAAAPAAQRVAPVGSRTVWFEHAKFSHTAHRGVSCADCHRGTKAEFRPNGEMIVNEREPILIRGIESCRDCHGPARTEVAAGGAPVSVGGVRANCTDCHRYHNGDHPLQGRGATARDPRAPLAVPEFLRGGPDPHP